jgi:hypothetical protein
MHLPIDDAEHHLQVFCDPRSPVCAARRVPTSSIAGRKHKEAALGPAGGLSTGRGNSAGALHQLALTLDVPLQYFFDGLSRRDKKRGKL